MSFEPNTKFLEKVANFIDEVEGMSFIPRHAVSLLEHQEYEELDAFIDTVRKDQDRQSGFFQEAGDVY